MTAVWAQRADTADALSPAPANHPRTFAARVLRVRDDRAWCIGPAGEDTIDAQLDLLGPLWRSVPIRARGLEHQVEAPSVRVRGADDVDRMVVGPGGVFTISAKDHPHSDVWVSGRTFVVDGQRMSYVRNNRNAARRAASWLSASTGMFVDVRSVISVGGAQLGFTVAEQPEHGLVHVVARMQLADFLTQRTEVLGYASIERIVDAARRRMDPIGW
ncbi:hypothetical protein SAMN05892883_0174 [Jatrophihabitans sp. GAS493]|uniref:hypothetical protein n=1 Tax=Jatrophihabitans sp. GAS493 TaxID=1907575 RepID=UPI000BB77043|nr:hypothetical protein [Jatrophihabitans sp. GAS493]SOD70478.1 hypothetical protein SAMN05892883_0174 [Jatrophihabitans sp. GAS493]